jgi:hypothetical protein
LVERTLEVALGGLRSRGICELKGQTLLDRIYRRVEVNTRYDVILDRKSIVTGWFYNAEKVSVKKIMEMWDVEDFLHGELKVNMDVCSEIIKRDGSIDEICLSCEFSKIKTVSINYGGKNPYRKKTSIAELKKELEEEEMVW